MVITNLEEKENRKIWVPIRPGNRGGWSLFEWEKVRDMPYRDRQMYLGNSAKIGVLDKGGKWRKKDWYLHKDKLESGEELNSHMTQAMRRDQQRMNAALGITEEDDHEQKLTPAEMAILLKRVRGNKDDEVQEVNDTLAVGLGFDKMKVQIRAKPTAKEINPHRLEGNLGDYEQTVKIEEKKSKKKDRSRSRSQKKKKHKKEKTQRRERSESQERHRKKEKHRQRSRSSDRKDKKKKEKKHKHHRDDRD